MTKFNEIIPRTLSKLVTWRIIMIIQYIAIGYFTTGSIMFGVGLAGVTAITNSIIYYLHERAWNRNLWGKKVIEEASA